MRQFSKSRTQVLRRYRSFDISKLSTTSQKNKNIMFLNLRTNLLSFWFIHVPMHKGRHYRLFMKLKLYTNPSNGCFISNFKSVGQETWSALFPSTHYAVLEYFIRVLQGINYVMSHDYVNQTPCGRHTYKRTLCFPSMRSLPSTPTTAKQDKGIRKRNCLSTIAKMVEMQQYKDNGEERNCSNFFKVPLPRLPDVHGEPPKPNARTGPSQGSRKSVTLETAAKHLKETYDFQRIRTAKTVGANLSGTNSTQKEQSPNKLPMSLFDMFLKK